jgi:chromosomal replication initiator protein
MCRHWFDDIEPLEVAGGTLRLLVREPVQLKYLQRSCQNLFTEAAQAVTGRLLAVKFVGEGDLPGAAAKAGRAEADAHEPCGLVMSDEDMTISPDYTFDAFIVGPSNRLAHAAAIAVANQPGKAYSPLFVHGGVGLGKTHLLHAICQSIMRYHPQLKIYYISCESFVDQFNAAVQAGQMNDFRYRFRNVDVMVIDDIHDLTQRDRSQEEFFHTFNTLFQAGKQIVLSSDAAPKEIPHLEERLTSRFNSGLVARIDKPCYETRVSIVKAKARLRSLTLPDDVATYIAAKIDTNIREIEGTIVSLQNLARTDNAEINLDLAKIALADESAAGSSAHPTIQNIIDAVTVYFDVKLTDLLSKKRHKSVTTPRQICMWLARKHTRYSLEEIGGYFGGRDHTTVMHAIKAVDWKRSSDQSLDLDVSRVEQQLLSQMGGG